MNTVADITASADGRVWMQGFPAQFALVSSTLPLGIIFKSPGAIDQNYAGLWQFALENQITVTSSQPIEGYIAESPQSIIYDEARQALYSISVRYSNSLSSNNMRIVFIISRDNGQTWSDAIDISTSNFANRGFQSMALDPVTGNLIFGWYDGRNDLTFKSIQYFGAILPAAQLDALVNRIPLSNPLYNLGSAA